jgi:Bacterial PH domain
MIMSTKDGLPERLDLPVDAPRLTRYLRLQDLACWGSLALVMGGLLGVLLAMAHVNKLPAAAPMPGCARFAAVALLEWAGFLKVVLPVLGAWYGLYAHWARRRQAEALRVRVEGPFLIVEEGGGLLRRSRKLHFRAIQDYSLEDAPLLRRAGIRRLRLTLNSPMPLVIDGLCNPDETRDLLARLDAERENG